MSSRLRRVVAAGGALVGIAVVVALQVYVSGLTVAYLAQPLPVPGGGQVVGYELAQSRVSSRATLGVTVYGRDLPLERALPLVVAPSGFNAAVEPEVDLERADPSPAGLQARRMQVEIPPFWPPGAYSLRLLGTDRTFGHFEITP